MRALRVFSLVILVACGASEARPVPPAPSAASSAPEAPAVPLPTVSAVSSAPPPPAPPAVPAEVDQTAPLPDSATVLAKATDGTVLLGIRGIVELPGRAQTYETYFALLDARRDCIDATARTHTLDRAASGSADEVLALLATPAAQAEIARLRDLARRFGIRALGPLVLGVDDAFTLLDANNELFVSSGVAFTQLPVGTSARPAPSPTGTHVAFAHCGSPCSGVYAPALLDTRTRKVKDFKVGNAHDFHWSKDGKSLYFSYDDRTSPLAKRAASNVCVGRLDVDSSRVTTLKCLPSDVMTENISSASPGVEWLGLQVYGGKPGSTAYVVLAAPSGKEAFRLAADPIDPRFDEAGRIGWTDNDHKDFHLRAHVASASGQQVFDDARFVGFAGADEILVMPDDQPSNARKKARTLRDKRCGHFATRPLTK
jgi:hypothetical protein